MRLEVMKNAVTSRVARQILIGQKHSPTLLFAGGIVGVAGTVVLACRATLKLEDVLEDAEATREKINALEHPRYSNRDRKRDLALLKVQTAGNIAKLYAPTVAVGVVSIGALTGSHVVLNRRNVALTAAYKALEEGFEQYRQRVREELGEDKERELRHDIRQNVLRVDDTKNGEVKQLPVKTAGTPSIYARFFDETNLNWNPVHEYNLMFLSMKQNYLNDKLHARGHVFLNEVYDELSLERSKAGAVVGWVLSKDGDNYIDFGVHNIDSPRARDFVNGHEPAILLDFNVDGVIYDKI